MLIVGFVWIGVILLQFILTYSIYLIFALALGKPVTFYSFAPNDIMKTLTEAVTSLKGLTYPYTVTLTITTLVADILPAIIAFKGLGIIPSTDIFTKPKTKPVTTALFCVVALGASYIVSMGVNLLNLLLKALHVNTSSPSFNVPWDKPLAAVLMIFTIVIFAPVAEEFLCRGVLLTVFKRFGNIFAIVASSLIWALLHGNIIQGIPVFAMGIIFGILALKSNSILPTIIIHSINNLISLISLSVINSKNLNLSVLQGGFNWMIMILGIIFFFAFKKEFLIKKEGDNKHGFITFFTSPTIIIAILYCIYLFIKSFKIV